MEKEGLFTTVVGSFPLEDTTGNMKRAFEDQIKLGIDYLLENPLEALPTSTLLENGTHEFRQCFVGAAAALV